MSDKMPKPTTQEIFMVLADILNRDDAVREAIFGDVGFIPERFLVVEPSKGMRQVLWVGEGDVVAYCHEDAVMSALLCWTDALPAEYSTYKLVPSKATHCVKHWINTAPVTDLEAIEPVRQLSTKGYAFHRLDFDMAPGETPIFDELLSRMETNREAFQAFIGMLFDKTAPRQYYLWLYGKGGDGKGTISRLLKRFLADAYVALSDDIKQHNQFFTSRLPGKRLGVFPDAENRDFVRSGMFMSITGGDPVFIERKGKDGYTAEIDTLCMMLSNKLPNIGSSKAHMRRACICRMVPRDSDEQDPEYEENLWAERAAILHRCYSIWMEMKKKCGHLIVDIDASLELAEDNESFFGMLLERHFALGSDSETEQAQLYAVLKDQNLSNNAIGEFYEWLERAKGIRRVRRRSGERAGSRVFPGIGLRLVGEDNPRF